MNFFGDWRDRGEAAPLVRVLEIRGRQDASKILYRLLIIREETRSDIGAALALSYIQLDTRNGGMNNHRFRGEYEKWQDGTERVSITGGSVMLDLAHLRGFHLGTYLQDEVVRWAKQWPNAAIRRIWLSPVDSQDENRERRNRFYEQFGIQFDYAEERKSGTSTPMLASALKPVDRVVWERDITECELVAFIRDQSDRIERLRRANSVLGLREENISKSLDEAQKSMARLWRAVVVMALIVGFLSWF